MSVLNADGTINPMRAAAWSRNNANVKPVRDPNVPLYNINLRRLIAAANYSLGIKWLPRLSRTCRSTMIVHQARQLKTLSQFSPTLTESGLSGVARWNQIVTSRVIAANRQGLMAETYLPKTEYERLAGMLLSVAPIPNEPRRLADHVTDDVIRAALGEHCDVWPEAIDPNKLRKWPFKIVGRAKQ